MAKLTLKTILSGSFILLSVAACNDDDDSTSSASTTTTTTTSTQTAVSIDFKANVNGAPFVCGQTYQNVGVSSGATNNTYRIDDFRLYIQNVELVKADNTRTAVTLNQDGTWQYKTIALLDFETGCSNGTSEMNTQIRGQLPAGSKLSDYKTLCFKVGLPFEENHIDPGLAPAPLNASGMLWSWTTGRKFVRIDGVGIPDELSTSFHFHLGSTGCTDSTGTGKAPDGPCTYPNQPEVCLNNFDSTQHVVVADIGKVLAQSNVAVNTPETAEGCMSGNNDPECIPIFPKLGMDFTYQPTGVAEKIVYPKEQQVFFQTVAK